MINLSKEQIEEIAENLDVGFSVFINIHTNETILLRGDGDDDFSGLDDDDPWAADRKKVEKNPKDYYEFEKMGSRESFSMMEEFAETIAPDKLRQELINALRSRGPFRHFKYIIDDSGEYRQKWFDFKDLKLQEYVRESIQIFNLGQKIESG